MKILILIPFFGLLFSCAGPTTPFGGQVFIGEEFNIDKTFKVDPNISFSATPNRQYYNSPYDLVISILDPNFDIKNFRYEIIYNNRKLNRWMKTEEIQFPQQKNQPIKISFKNLSILPGNINNIAFLYYPNGTSNPIIHRLKVPECLKELKTNKLNVTPYNISQSLKQNIINISDKYGYNPSLVAAVIAQESSFNPKALSPAKALGLTQVTPLAHQEVKKIRPDWKIYPSFRTKSIFELKQQLANNAINKKNDWRLDQKKSIEGGILYLDYLTKYWNNPSKQEILADVFQHDVPKLDIMLASYNSGPARVSRAIANNKKEWLFDDNLNEARKYVMNIKSYCYSFNQEDSHEK